MIKPFIECCDCFRRIVVETDKNGAILPEGWTMVVWTREGEYVRCPSCNLLLNAPPTSYIGGDETGMARI